MSRIADTIVYGCNWPYFWLTFLIELVVIALVVRQTIGGSHRHRPLGGRLVARSQDTSGFWCLPFYVWAWQANLRLGELISHPAGLVSDPRIYGDTLQEIFTALFYLLALQTIGTLITNEAPVTLGVTGRYRTAAVVAMISVFLNIASFFMLKRVFSAPYGLPLYLQ